MVAEPGALIAFAGPRVVQKTTKEKLPTTSASPSRTSASATSTRSSLDPSCARTWRGSCGSLAGDAELRLRERLGRLSNLPLLRGTRVSGEQRAAARAARADRAEAPRPRTRSGARSSSRGTRTGRTRSTTSSGSSTTGSSCTATAAAPTTARSSPGSAGSTAARSRSSATRRAATSRSALDRQFGMAVPGGLREGDARDGARGALRLPGRLARRHAGRVPGRRRRAARPGRRDRPLAGADGAARRARRSRA